MSVIETALDASSGTIDIDQEALAHKQKEFESARINFWKSRIESTAKLNTYQDFKRSKDSARAFFRGDFFSQDDKSKWEGDIVQANLFRRTVNFMVDAIYAQNPNIRVMLRRKGGMLGQAAEILEDHLEYVFEEENLRAEVRRTWKDAYFGNLSATKLDFDRERGLWRAKWVAGLLICDPDARGDVSRARWIAEQVIIPKYRVWQDETFDPEARQQIKERSSTSDISYSEYGTTNESISPDKNENKDAEVLWYIYTKEGIDPLSGSEQGPTRNRLIVICEGCDKFLLNLENPTPFLDNDEFPYAILRLDELPGEFIGPALWRLVEGVVVSFNWAASYHMSDMRKTASRPIGYDKNKVDDPDKTLKSRKHMVPVPCDGPPKDIIAPLNIGAADKTIFDSVQFFRDLLDKITGIDDIARGEEGRTKTATESQILQQNSNIALKGPATAFDFFLNDMIRKLGLASLYYTPAFSTVQGPDGQFYTRQVVQVPTPMPDPMTGMVGMAMQPQIIQVPAMGATQPIKGIDYFHGDQAAMVWPQMPFEEVKCELNFSIEAGSTRVERRLEKQRTVSELMNTLGVELSNLGFLGEKWELWNQYLEAFEVSNKSKILPPKEMFIMQGQMMMQAMMQQQAQGNGDGAGNADSGKFSQTKNEGKKFPLNGQSGKDESTGA